MNEQQKSDARQSTSWLGRILFIFVILATIALLVVGGYFGLNFIVSKIDASGEQSEKIEVEVKRHEEDLENLRTAVQGIQDQLQRFNLIKDVNWNPVIVEYLIRVADLTLNTTGDARLAITFLSTARKYTTSPELSALNHALNKDIAQLQMVPVVDSSELILKIEALNQKIDTLPLIAPMTSAVTGHGGDAVQTKEQSLWQKFLTTTAFALRDILIVRHRVVTPLPGPEQEAMLRLNIQSKFVQAQYAVMQRQNKLYHECLGQVEVLIGRYFTTHAGAVADILSTLQQLQQVNLQPQLPALTGSIMAVSGFVNSGKEQLKQEVQAHLEAGAKQP